MLVANFQSVFTLLVLFFFWKAVFAGQTVIKGYTLPQMVTYYFLVRVTYNRVSAFIATHTARDIKTGDIVKILLQPVNYLYYITTYHYLMGFFWTIGNLVVILLFSPFLHGMLILPSSFFSALLFLLAFCLNGLLSSLLNTLVGFVAFWITEITHLKTILTALISILSGGLIPLYFYPEKFQRVLMILPFKYLVQFPSDIYFGKFTFQSLCFDFSMLIVWVVLLLVLCQLVLKKGLRVYESFN